MPEFDYTDYGPKYVNIPNFSDYKIGTDGSVLSCRKDGIVWKEMKQAITTRGYLQVTLSGGNRSKSFLTHRLVLLAFVGGCPAGMECAHGDGNRKNANLNNLRWATSKQNNADKEAHGTILRGEQSCKSILTEEKVRMVIQRLAGGESAKLIASDYGVSRITILDIRDGRSWVHLTRKNAR